MNTKKFYVVVVTNAETGEEAFLSYYSCLGTDTDKNHEKALKFEKFDEANLLMNLLNYKYKSDFRVIIVVEKTHVAFVELPCNMSPDSESEGE